LALAKELTEAGAQVVAIVRSSSAELDALKPAEVVTGIDVTNDEQCASGIASQIKGGPIDIVRANAFLLHLEGGMESNRQLDICAVKGGRQHAHPISSCLSLLGSSSFFCYWLAHNNNNNNSW
jgi:NAD(P)-dependent dehydrogenase (short-subunit alcohol dehydrogenase family)